MAGTEYVYWQLVESRRTERGPRQRVVAYLGDMDGPRRLGITEAARGKDGSYQESLLSDQVQPEWVEVDSSRLRVERVLDFGAHWLGLQLMEKLGLLGFLDSVLDKGREEIPWSVMAMVLVLMRLVDPSSELRIAEQLFERSALGDLLGIPLEKVNDDRLYRALDEIRPHKEALEKHPKERLGRMFHLEYDLLLYDITSTYFEGECPGNGQARFGYSRDKRGDCKQVCIGLVVSRDGLPLGLEFLQSDGRRYIVGTPRGQLRQFQGELAREEGWEPIMEGLSAKLIEPEGGKERFILCRSLARGAKEKAMLARFAGRIEEGLKQLAEACGGEKKLRQSVVERRVGALLTRNSRARGLFKVKAGSRQEGGASIEWEKLEKPSQWAELVEGRLLPAANQRPRWQRGGAMADLHPAHRGGSGLPDPEERPGDTPPLAPEGRAGCVAHPGVLPGPRAVEDPGSDVQGGWAGE
ncbi:MAG: hypothetical protein Q7S81_00320 [bacterium]|nr:hypothetical protein [bacterium]